MTTRQKKAKRIMLKTLFYITTIVIVFICSLPLIWTFLTSIKTPKEIYAFPLIYIPRQPTLKNYLEVFLGSVNFGRYLLNSLIVSSFATLLSIGLSSIASYSLARLRFRGRRTSLLFILALSMFPPIAIVPTLFLFFRSIGFVNTYWSLILVHSAFFSPMAVWILTNYFKTIPMDLEDAARIDGCTSLGILKNVIFPLSLPGLVSAGLIVFIFSWNEFMASLVLLSKNELRTAVVGISLYPGEYAFPWELITTATFLAIIPLILFTLLFQKYIVGGLTAGAIKS
ncbi:MAG: carbohydrate ABC transporter permease [Candidatus Njordarchaeales archaeon]